MAQVVLTAVGTAFGGPLGGLVGGVLGGLADKAIVSSLAGPRQVGGRLSGLELHSTSAGAPMPAAFGRARVAGQTIWAARFREKRVETRTGGGKGSSQKTVSYTYSLSFAVALGEGPIDGIGRIWADGTVMDTSAVTMRLYKGSVDQEPDPLIEAVEGEAPAYRGTPYLVFEDLPLDTWGNRPPQLNVEVFRRPEGDGALEQLLTSINLIPGAGEFVLSPTPELRVVGDAAYASENVHDGSGHPDLMVALDQLQAQLPNVRHVNLVVAWFGSDLRCGVCECRPGVESRGKVTTPDVWRVEVDRAGAHLISQSGGGPAYGGTPSDSTVLACLAELARRGVAVTLYPFLMMDVPLGNGLPDPYGAAEQAPYPWRGRITGAVAPGRTGTTDKTGAAATQVAHFFGSAAPAQFAADAGGVSYSGPDEWSYRRLVLHYARLAASAGGVEGFLIGSELRGLTTLRSAAGVYPAVAKLKALGADVKGMLGGGVQVGYSGDWSEYFGHQPTDGSGDAIFHLDPLWADPAIDFVGVDYYPPLADWRAGDGGLDAELSDEGPYDPDYLAANVLGGEDFDWFYASAAARTAQTRTPITDGAYGEPWVYRAKDLHAWWSNAHHDRPSGVRSAAATAWVPGSKPLRLVEFGCPAVDRGSNSPNLFIDPKSSESALPIDSTGVRDDLVQRRACEAVLGVYLDSANNPVSGVYGGPMIAKMSAWCWDARPYPAFPALTDVWKDGPNWTLGHWLTGRVGQGAGGDLIRTLLHRAGLTPADYVIEGASADAAGYVVPGPASTADLLQPLTEAFGFDAAEHGGKIAMVGRESGSGWTVAVDAQALPDEAPDPRSLARTLAPTPDLVRVRFLDEGDAYQAGSVVRRAGAVGGAGPATLELPVVMTAAGATTAADRRLARALAERDAITIHVGPLAALQAEAGDRLAVEGLAGVWRVLRVDLDETPRLQLVRAEYAGRTPRPTVTALPRSDPPPTASGPPSLLLFDPPPLEGAETDARPLAAVAVDPWRPFDVHAGPTATTLTRRGAAAEPGTLGVLVSPLPPGPLNRWDEATRLVVRPAAAGVLASCTRDEVRAGQNALAVRNADGEWEVLQFAVAEPAGGGAYTLSGLLRGQLGTKGAMTGVDVGAPWMRLDGSLVRLNTAMSERGLPLTWRAAPAGGPAGGAASTDAVFTWRGAAARPWAPAHIRATRTSTGLRLDWVRRARLGGDVWDGEPPLGETSERYRVEVLAGAAAGIYETTAPSLMLTPADLGASPYLVSVDVRQGSETWGWGPPARRDLWL